MGQSIIPVGLSNVVAIAAGALHSLALRSDGTVIAWGWNLYGQTNVPAGLSNVVALAGGGAHSLALRSDGTIAAWGFNYFSQTNVPAGLSNVVAIAGGEYHSLALQSDGAVVAWGAGLTNEVNGGDYQANFGQSIVPVGLSSIPFTVSGSVNTNAPGIYPLTYTAINTLGGSGSATRTVVVQDTLLPVITLLGNNPIILTNAQPFSDPGATALDLCSGSLAVTSSNNVNVNFPGVYSVVYHSTDGSGNHTSATRTVSVSHPPTVPGDQNGDGIVSQSELDAVYGSYVPNSPWLYMTNVAGLGSTNVSFALDNSVSGAYSVQYSTNLVDWLPLGPATPRYLFTDTNAPTLPQRYYRLSYP